MSRARLLPALVLAVLVAAGCDSGPEPGSAGSGADETPPFDPPYLFGPLDDVGAEHRAADVGGAGAELFDVAVAGQTDAVLLVGTAQGALEVARQQSGGWRRAVLPELDAADGDDSGVAVDEDDGTAVVVTRVRDGLVVSTVTSTGTVRTAEVTDSALAGSGPAVWGTTPDGATVYAAVSDDDGAWTLVSVGVEAGEVEDRRPLEAPSPSGLRVTGVAADDERVVVVADVDTDAAGTAHTSVLRRFATDLEPRDEVALSAGPSDAGPVVLDAGGTAYVPVVEGGVTGPAPALLLMRVHDFGTEPGEEARFPGQTYVRSVSTDPAGEYVYLGGLVNGASTTALTVTAVHVGSHDEPVVVPLCPDGLFRGAAVAAGAVVLVAIGECDTSAGDPEWRAWTIN
ncbi:hypothetical protein [Blastococcus sp. SYSU D00813]